MTVVSAKEFNSYQDKYLNLAVNEQVFIQNDNYMFLLTRTDEPKQEYKEPDEDFYRAITSERLLKGIYEDIDKKFASRYS